MFYIERVAEQNKKKVYLIVSNHLIETIDFEVKEVQKEGTTILVVLEIRDVGKRTLIAVLGKGKDIRINNVFNRIEVNYIF